MPPDFAADHRLANLTDLARRYVQRKKQEAMNRLDDLYNNLGKIADNNVKIRRLQESFNQADIDKVRQLRTENAALVAELETLENKITKAIRAASDIALGIRDLGKPEVYAAYGNDPTGSIQWTYADRQGISQHSGIDA